MLLLDVFFRLCLVVFCSTLVGMMSKKQIIGAIMLATDKTVEEFAKIHGYTKHAFYDTISGRTKSATIRRIIAEAIGKPVSEIWPEAQKG